jgi:uncharacterized protein YbjT (DUF2867 family)
MRCLFAVPVWNIRQPTKEDAVIVVTGATGTIGRPLVEQLLGSGQSVRAVIHRAGAESLPAGIDVVECDLSA